MANLEQRILSLVKEDNNSKAAELFNRFLPMSHFIAGKVAALHKLQFQEVAAAAEHHLAVLCCRWRDPNYYRHYDPEKSSEQTWMYRNLCWLLYREFDPRRQRKMTTNLELEIKQDGRKKHILDRLRIEISEDAIEVVKAILHAPGDLMGSMFPAKGPSKRMVRKAKKAALLHVISQGWNNIRFQQAWNEISEAI